MNAFGEDAFGGEVYYYEHIAIGSGLSSCGFVAESRIDQDKDGIDDACDPIYISQAEEANIAGSQEKAQESVNSSATDLTIEDEQANTESEIAVWNREQAGEGTQIAQNGGAGEVLSSVDTSNQQQVGVFSSDDYSDDFDAIVISILAIGGLALLIFSTRYALKG